MLFCLFFFLSNFLIYCFLQDCQYAYKYFKGPHFSQNETIMGCQHKNVEWKETQSLEEFLNVKNTTRIRRRFEYLNKIKTKRLSNHMSQYFIYNRT